MAANEGEGLVGSLIASVKGLLDKAMGKATPVVEEIKKGALEIK
jgi:hypothetical protein